MKNNLHTELRKKWNEFYGDDFKDGLRDRYFDFWLQKFDELQSATSPDAIVKHDTLEELIEAVEKLLKELKK